jgi:phosphatidylglycerol:prolipoprotein diacylglycerol transferase
VALGFLTAFFVGQKLVVKKKKILSLDEFTNLVFYVFISGIVGARGLWLLENHELVSNDYSLIYRIWQGGMSLYGGLILAFFTIYIYARLKKKINFSKLLDSLIIPVVAGLAVARIGCFMIMDHLGKATYLLWGQVDEFGITRHPIALYLILAHLLFLLGIYLIKKYTKYNLKWGLAFLIYYPLMRLVIDTFRVKQGIYADPNYLGVSVAQAISFLILLGLASWGIYQWLEKNDQKNLSRRKSKK